MNNIFKVIWNTTTGRWVVTSELGQAQGKTKTSSLAKLTTTLGAVALGLSSSIALADPVFDITTQTLITVDKQAHPYENTVWDIEKIYNGESDTLIDIKDQTNVKISADNSTLEGIKLENIDLFRLLPVTKTTIGNLELSNVNNAVIMAMAESKIGAVNAIGTGQGGGFDWISHNRGSSEPTPNFIESLNIEDYNNVRLTLIETEVGDINAKRGDSFELDTNVNNHKIDMEVIGNGKLKTGNITLADYKTINISANNSTLGEIQVNNAKNVNLFPLINSALADISLTSVDNVISSTVSGTKVGNITASGTGEGNFSWISHNRNPSDTTINTLGSFDINNYKNVSLTFAHSTVEGNINANNGEKFGLIAAANTSMGNIILNDYQIADIVVNNSTIDTIKIDNIKEFYLHPKIDSFISNINLTSVEKAEIDALAGSVTLGLTGTTLTSATAGNGDTFSLTANNSSVLEGISLNNYKNANIKINNSSIGDIKAEDIENFSLFPAINSSFGDISLTSVNDVIIMPLDGSNVGKVTAIGTNQGNFDWLSHNTSSAQTKPIEAKSIKAENFNTVQVGLSQTKVDSIEVKNGKSFIFNATSKTEVGDITVNGFTQGDITASGAGTSISSIQTSVLGDAESGKMDVVLKDEATLNSLTNKGDGSTTSAMKEVNLSLDNVALKLDAAERSITGIHSLLLDNGSSFSVVGRENFQFAGYNADGLFTNEFVLDIKDVNSKYALSTNKDHALNHQLSGDGIYAIDLETPSGGVESTYQSTNKFTIAPEVDASTFKGTYQIANAGFDLNSHESYLTDATLMLKSGAYAMYDGSNSNSQMGKIKHLDFAGGTLEIAKGLFDPVNPYKPLSVIDLSLSQDSFIKLNEPALLTEIKVDDPNKAPGEGYSDSYFDQVENIGESLVLVQADNVHNPNGVQLELDTSAEDGSVVKDIENARADRVGTAYYNFYGLTTDQGIELQYGLVRLDSNKGKDPILLSNVGTTNDTLGARLTGGGGFVFEGDTETMEIGHSKSNYTGETIIKGGDVEFITDNGFGQTSLLRIDNGSKIDLVEYSQTVGVFADNANSTVNINDGQFTITGDSEIKGSLEGNVTGSLSFVGNNATIEKSNTDLHSSVFLRGATVTASEIDSLGTGAITLSTENDKGATLRFSGIDNQELANTLKADSQAMIVLEDSHIGVSADNKEFAGTFSLEGKNGATILDVLGGNSLGYNSTVLFNGDSTLNFNYIPAANNEEINYKVNLKGDGVVAIMDGSKINLTGNNGEFTGRFDIKSQAMPTSLALNDDSFAPADIAFGGTGGTLSLSLNNHHNYGNLISGDGEVTKRGKGNLTFTTDQTYTGKTAIEAGSVFLGKNVRLSSSDVVLSEGGQTGGYGTYAGNVDNQAGGTLRVGSASGVAADYGVLTIEGDYSGAMALPSTVLGQVRQAANSTVILGANSFTGESDRLIIEGSVNGYSWLKLDNFITPPAGIDPVQIDLITANGGVADAAAFTYLGGSESGGAYDYFLQYDNNGTWVLSSLKNPSIPVPPVVPPVFPWWPTPNPDWPWGWGNGWGNGWNNGLDPNRIYRSDIGSYLANLEAANEMFSHSLHDRNYDENNRLWTRVDASFGKFNNQTRQFDTKVDNYTFQVGYDFLQTFAGGMPFKLGGTVGYGHTSSKSTNQFSGIRSKGRGDGFAIGVYGTLGDERKFYLDGSLQYVYFDNKVKRDYFYSHREKYKNKGVIASVEGGYTFNAAENFYIQPQLQLTYQGVKQDTHREANLTRVTGSKNNLQTRLGVRFFGDTILGNGAKASPYGELSYIHNTKDTYVEMNDLRIKQNGAKNMGEVKLGSEFSVGTNGKLWGDLSHRFGSQSYRDTKVSVGFKYEF